MSEGPGVGHLFRREYGRMVATLTRRVGAQHFEKVEDAAQTALLKAVEEWPRAGTPSSPAAWLYRTAKNALIDVLRTEERRAAIVNREPAVEASRGLFEGVVLASELEDDLLRMLFVCCHGCLPRESQLVLALKTLCGFGVGEISARLFVTEASVYKRLYRARVRMRTHADALDALEVSDYARTLPAVHRVLYLLFTEGFCSSHPERSIREELCLEAIRLVSLLATHRVGQTPETYALVALMHLNAARLPGRRAGETLLLLEEQDRRAWDQEHIRIGLEWLGRSAQGESFSRYHAEAAIAAEHCLAPTYAATRWEAIVELYLLWERVEPSPIHRLNRALAVAEARGAEEGLAVVSETPFPLWLEGSYLLHATLAELYRRHGDVRRSKMHESRAIADAPSAAVRTLLVRRANRTTGV